MSNITARSIIDEYKANIKTPEYEKILCSVMEDIREKFSEKGLDGSIEISIPHSVRGEAKKQLLMDIVEKGFSISLCLDDLKAINKKMGNNIVGRLTEEAFVLEKATKYCVDITSEAKPIINFYANQILKTPEWEGIK